MTAIFTRKALLASGWADDVRLVIVDGHIDAIETAAVAASGDHRTGCVIPGLCNAHSHAFQRALAGWTEQSSPVGRDNFWTWRERMYTFAAAMNAERLQRIARQAYVEMLSAGYTSVAEFHYLHRDSGGGENSMFDAITTAADASGIRLTYVPVLYERGGFDRPEPEGSQALFALNLDEFLRHADHAQQSLHGRMSAGIGAHSIRAVSPESLAEIAKVANSSGMAMHIHIAEQQREVDQCLAFYERRPVRWLLENFDVQKNWCLVHATHMDNDEITQLAGTTAVVCLCPSTEANLGDGLFPLRRFLSAGGRIAIGSDSHVSINPFEELRWLEYGQRLAAQTRNVAVAQNGHDKHVGRELFVRAIDGGAQACGHESSGLKQGSKADIVCLYGEDPMLVGHDDASRLDALVFSGYQLPIERVMVDGDWCVVDGEHVTLKASRADYGRTVQDIANEWGVR
ncbi:MAG: formimidoylglutamate deiminase [Gammaproteobacteria bacterium]|nr:formimidoylglutamate deiminase [Gammaproteobacteria bacterium]